MSKKQKKGRKDQGVKLETDLYSKYSNIVAVNEVPFGLRKVRFLAYLG